MRVAFENVHGLDVSVGPLIPTPFEHDAWHRNVLGSFTDIKRRDLKTQSGWPVAVYSARDGDGSPITAAFFTFFEYCASAIVRCDTSDEVIDVVRTAEPVWDADGLVVCLAGVVS